jgi:surfactin synthase thioesterase subunit
MLPVFRADFALCDTYRYLPDYPLSCDLTVLGGREDPHVPPDELDAWQLETRGRCTVSLFPGDHFFIRVYAPQVLEVVSRSLQASWQSRSAVFQVNR